MTPMNLEDIARLAGVSRSTVSRVINDDPRVSDAARARVQAVIAEHHYHPNAAARSLASRRTRVIGLLIPVYASKIFSDPWFPIMIQGCMDGCQEQDLSLMLLMESETDADASARLVQRMLHGRHLDGVVIATSLIDGDSIDLLERRRFPFVVIGRTPGHAAAWVDIDNEGAAYTATCHLLSHGRTRAAMLAGPESLVASIDRTAGFLRATDEAGVPSVVVHAGFDQREAHDILASWLTGPEPPDAIFAASDVMAVGAVQAARRLGVNVPDQLGVVGFDDIQPGRMSALGITSLRQPARELGRRAVELLNERIADPTSPPLQVLLPTELIIRTSCGCLPLEREHAQPADDERSGGVLTITSPA
jgi:LacI family transcriptional regulator